MSWSNLETNFLEGEATQALIFKNHDKNDAASVGTSQLSPRIVTATSGDSLAIVIDHNLHIFGAKGKQTEFSVHLKTPVVALTWVEVGF